MVKRVTYTVTDADDRTLFPSVAVDVAVEFVRGVGWRARMDTGHEASGDTQHEAALTCLAAFFGINMEVRRVDT
jgi:hypothetical protein